MRNGFLFDGLHGVTQQLHRMKGKLIWQFSQLYYCMGMLTQEEMDLCHLVLLSLSLSLWVIRFPLIIDAMNVPPAEKQANNLCVLCK